MSGKIELDEKFDKWIKWLKTTSAKDSAVFKDRLLRSAGLQMLNRTMDYTPKRSGRLQNSLAMGNKENVFTIQVGSSSFVVVGTMVEYAAAVENGFKQRKGRFVPGFWSSGVFHYQPGAKEGMVLRGAKIVGAHMFQKGLDTMIDRDLEKIAEAEFRRLYAALNG